MRKFIFCSSYFLLSLKTYKKNLPIQKPGAKTLNFFISSFHVSIKIAWLGFVFIREYNFCYFKHLHKRDSTHRNFFLHMCQRVMRQVTCARSVNKTEIKISKLLFFRSAKFRQTAELFYESSGKINMCLHASQLLPGQGGVAGRPRRS